MPQVHSSLPEHGLTHSQIHAGAHHVEANYGDIGQCHVCIRSSDNFTKPILGQSPQRYQRVERPLQDAGGRGPHLASEAGAGQSLRGHLTHVSAQVDGGGQAGQADTMHRQIIK